MIPLSRPLLENRFFRLIGFRYSPDYLRRDLRSDLISGLTVAIMGVPQSMAYALIAGVPPVYGLYTSIVSCMIGALLGSSNHLVTGPTNASCMVIFSVTAPYLGTDSHMEAVFLLTIICGVVKIAFGIFRMGGIVRYVSNSVVIGFTTGVAILIVGNQIKNVLGVSIPSGSTRHFYDVLIASVGKAGDANPYSVAVAAFTIAFVVLLARINRKIPGPFLAIASAAALVYALGWDGRGVTIVRDISPISHSLNIFHFPKLLWPPQWGMLHDLLAGAFAVAIFGLIEASTSSRGVAALSGQRLDFSREFLGQGVANLVGAFFSNFASSGSFVRSALCYQAGGRTRMAPAFSALFIAVVILLMAPLANYIPQASLAGMLFYVAYTMVSKQRERILMTWQSGGPSRFVLFGTFVSTLILPLQYAIFVGIFLSIMFLLKITGKADLRILVPRGGGRFDEIPLERAPDTPVVLIDMEGDLYFAAVENLDLEMQRALTPKTEVVVLRMKRLRAVGSSAIAMLDHFRAMLAERGVTMVICGVEPGLADIVRRSGLRSRIGEQNIFYADNTIYQSTELAIARAAAIVEMGRRRDETVSHPILSAWPMAADLMSRQFVRFGVGHSVREAVWLLSEVSRRAGASELQALFLQDREGRLAGKITPWRLLEQMTAGLDAGTMSSVDDTDLGRLFCRHFETVIGTLADGDLPLLRTDTPFSIVLAEASRRNLDVVPVCDQGGRMMGLVGRDDMLRAVGQTLNMVSLTERIQFDSRSNVGSNDASAGKNG